MAYLKEVELFKTETAGYSVPLTPKTRSAYNAKTNSYKERGDYSTKELLKAEKAFLTLKELFHKEYSDVFLISQDKPNSRIANIDSSIFLEEAVKRVGRNHNFSLFTLSLQSGRVYNFPVAQIEKTFKIVIDPKKIISHEGGNYGCTLKDGIKFLARARKMLAASFAAKGLKMSDENFSTMLMLSRLARTSIIVSNVDGWMEYIAAGKNLDSIVFGFDKKLVGSTKLPYIPVDEVDDYKNLPREWLESIFQIITKDPNKVVAWDSY